MLNTFGRIGLFLLMVAVFPIIAIGALVFGAIVNPFYRHKLQKKFLAKHGVRGHYILFVYDKADDSAEYIKEKILPRIEPYVTELHWQRSQKIPRRQRSLEVQVFHQYGGDSEAVPMALLIHPSMGVRIVRFGPAFDSLRQGNKEHLEHREHELMALVGDLKPFEQAQRMGQ